ncbi:protein kinase domain-containing protein [Planctomycetes bacterium K23_9]|uniref:Serine/threonine-protein kinase PknD n=1 Tax=Stieleria marina TaxID=1930275 RepID=A0A517NPR5_9BACT|nr:Serine/threonine-protein kinase PknD [Planctomycetes bacterium K23_9]
MRSLLDTIDDDGSLAKRLAEMPADAKTITLAISQFRNTLQHPSWADDEQLPLFSEVDTDSLNETIDGGPIEGAKPIDDGFVPPRRIRSLNDAANDDDDDVEYRLIGKLGSGGTGIVYQAHQRAIDREVAIKVLRSELAADPSSRSRFLAEARVIGALDHPNVIALHDLCIDDKGQLFYAMKRIDGTSWDLQIDEMDVEKNLSILLRVADAIRYAHSQGWIHRDLKPENVMLGRFGEVLVADWGLAVNCFPHQEHREHLVAQASSAIGGTPAYMSPELASGNVASLGFATDVYLLGAILYQILSGHPPHHGSNLLDCIQAAARNDIRSTDAQGELVDVALRAMATRPEDRYASVEDFVAAIEIRRTHEESERLVRRAKRRAWDTPPEDSDDPYEKLGSAITLTNEAMELWPENRRAAETLRRLQVDFARIAANQGDLDLSIRLYESAGEGESEAAARIRADRDRRDKARENQAKFSALFTFSPEAGLLIRWSDKVVIEVNDACTELLGYEKEELVGQVISKLTIWACPSRRQIFVEELAKNGRIDNFETQFLHRCATMQDPECEKFALNKQRTADGAELSGAESDGVGPDGMMPEGIMIAQPIDVLISARTVEVGGEEMLLSTIRDISKRREIERDLEQSRQRLKDLQRLAGLGTWSYDPVADEIRWSSETYRITGRDPAKGAPSLRELMNLVHPDDRLILNDAITMAMQNGASYQIRFRQKDDTGVYRNLLARGQGDVNEFGQTVDLYGVLMPAR